MTREQIDIEYKILSFRAYELYTKDWCATRNYPYEEVFEANKEDTEYNGEMFVCKAEFEDNEFLNEEYMKSLLSEEDFWCWNKVMDYLGLKNDDDYSKIDAEATRLLKSCTDDYASRIYDEIRDDVREDVVECSAISESGNMNDFSSGDIALAVGRAICERLGISI